jgi:UDP:flavonoid glycosyltransferase YjiC (YdhE family)
MSGRGRYVVAAFGDPGHAFPAFALARALKQRGNEVLVESWEQWQAPVEELGVDFVAAQQYTVFPPPGPDAPEAETAAGAARALAELIGDYRPDVVVSDILTQAPTLAAEVAGVPLATLIPHVLPVQEPGMPFFSLGWQPPRTPLGRLAWRLPLPLIEGGLRRGREDLNHTREALGLAPLERFHGGTSEELALVATFPQLEYPRRWPAATTITGPMFFELPWEPIEIPDGPEPLVLVAPSTAQDPMCEMLRAALDGLAEEPVRVVATTNKHRPIERLDVPDNAILVPWLSYSQLMPLADLVVCHGGHGTLARALDAGAPVLCCPHIGDMAENGARLQWSGAGLSLPRRLLGPGSLRRAVRRILGDGRFRERAGEISRWSAAHDGAERGALAVEQLARDSEGVAARGAR